jgi:hypothetical protein
MELLLGLIGISVVLGGIFWHQIDMARFSYKIKKHSDTWWENKTVIGKIVIIVALLLGICGLMFMCLIVLIDRFWHKYCCKDIERKKDAIS